MVNNTESLKVGEQMPTASDALEALDAMDDCARMDTGVDAIGPREVLRKFIEAQDGLTDEEIESIASKCWVTTAVIGGTTTGFAYGQFARAIARHLFAKRATTRPSDEHGSQPYAPS